MATTSNNNNKNRRLAVGVEEFALGKKGATRAIQEYKHRKDKKVKEKQILLRKYKKVKKQEGYAIGKSGNDGTPHEGGERESSEQQHAQPQHDDDCKRPARGGNKTTNKPNRYTKSLQKAQDYKNQQEEQRQQALLKQQENAKKLKQRKHRAKIMSKRTKRGQPIMKHAIHNILDKLQKEE